MLGTIYAVIGGILWLGFIVYSLWTGRFNLRRLSIERAAQPLLYWPVLGVFTIGLGMFARYFLTEN